MKYLLIGLLLFSMAVFAEDAGTVIVASDNEADLTAAEAAAAQDADAAVVTSPWGEDSNSTIESVLAKNPKKIIIIGGPIAIPDALELRLRDRLRIRNMTQNMTVIRVYGKDRYETAAEIAVHFWGNATNVVIVQGDDIREMQKRLLEAKQDRIPVLYIKNGEVPDYVKAKLKLLKVKNARLYLAPDANETEIDDDLKETEVRNVTKVKEKLAERALEALADAKEAIDKAEAVINITNETNNTTIAASRLLALAQREYANANASFENASYGRAFGQAVAAQAHAKAAVKIHGRVLSGDFMKQVEKVQKEIRERGMKQVREQAREELEKAREEFRENAMTRKTVSAVVRAGRQNEADTSNAGSGR